MPQNYPKVSQVLKCYPTFSQPYLVEADDGELYVLKHSAAAAELEMLAGEYIATKVGVLTCTPVLDCALIEVDQESIEYFENCPERNNCVVPNPGIYFASRYLDGLPAASYDMQFLFDSRTTVLNRMRATSAMAYDTLFQNADGHPGNILIVFPNTNKQTEFNVYLIDQGHIFLGPGWPALANPSMWNIYTGRANFYKSTLADIRSFLPQLSTDYAGINPTTFAQIASNIPASWGIQKSRVDEIENYLMARIPLITNAVDGYLTAQGF